MNVEQDNDVKQEHQLQDEIPKSSMGGYNCDIVFFL